MKIYTKTGDKGYTSLIGGTRVPKYHLRIECYGTIDELNAYIGLVRDQDINTHQKDILKEIQERLFTMGAVLASDPVKSKMNVPDIKEGDIAQLEQEMDKMNEKLPELKNFILPGGNTVISFCHLARCVCRRAERLVVQLSGEEHILDEKILIYLNRLSDFLFLLGRTIAMENKINENIWRPRS